MRGGANKTWLCMPNGSHTHTPALTHRPCLKLSPSTDTPMDYHTHQTRCGAVLRRQQPCFALSYHLQCEYISSLLVHSELGNYRTDIVHFRFPFRKSMIEAMIRQNEVAYIARYRVGKSLLRTGGPSMLANTLFPPNYCFIVPLPSFLSINYNMFYWSK